ncbi:hypothetical protein [Persicobacter diffluens]|uniref:Uncharacterized protein n=1 Tax=Persicobacter diffluens TaxID=981 RepID=A0AAN4VZ62_9BACT|nr:hypothetical protein PEDI_29900 [Persicobacter diffluens]
MNNLYGKNSAQKKVDALKLVLNDLKIKYQVQEDLIP